jgi:hypothetical protein
VVAFLVAFEPPGDSPDWVLHQMVAVCCRWSLAHAEPCTSWLEARPAVMVSVRTVGGFAWSAADPGRVLPRLALRALQWRGDHGASRRRADALGRQR